MSRERLNLALERIRPDQWKIFEEFASAFLTSQYPNIRTVATPSGDQGRDAELFSYDGRVPTVLQYSVSKDWRKKIKETAKRISVSLPDTAILIYVTSQPILSSADILKSDIMKDYGLILDFHDMDWFLDRFAGDGHREAVSEALSQKIVDPYLMSKGVLEHSAPTLSSTEFRAALTFLQLQWEDDTREKGLTKLSFEALVKTVLRNTSSESRLPRSAIHDQIMEMFPKHDSNHLKTLVDSALFKLTKRSIRHWTQFDEFCLTHQESERVRERLVELEVANNALDFEIQASLQGYLVDTGEIDKLTNLVRVTINHYLSERGEVFAGAIVNNQLFVIGVEDLQKSVEYGVKQQAVEEPRKSRDETVRVIMATVREMFTEPTRSVQNHLRTKADAYTLFAFLGRTPDIERAVSKMFSHGIIWLDTTVVLPLLAEELIRDGQRRFTQMLKVASAAGLKLRVTPGVVEEVERHINRCTTYVNMLHSNWRGSVPFLADAYMRSGRDLMAFASWIECFEGKERAEDDLAEYFDEFFAIKRENLEADEMRASEEVRFAVEEAWHAAHAVRRGSGDEGMDEMIFNKLVRHDVENYVGVIERRRKEGVSGLGYSAWWLTLDRLARQVDRRVKDNLGHETPQSPVMSADFLVNYLSVGPMRSKVTKEAEYSLPIALDVGVLEELPEDLMREAERIRSEAGGLSEHIVRRRVRDCLDAAKRRPGRIMAEGIQTVLETIKSN